MATIGRHPARARTTPIPHRRVHRRAAGVWRRRARQLSHSPVTPALIAITVFVAVVFAATAYLSRRP